MGWGSTQSSMGRVIDKQADGTYRANLDEVVANFFSHKSAVTLKVKASGTRTWTFTGEENLGLLNGGVCKDEGHADGSEFVCTYVSSMDKGTFHMKRAASGRQ